MHVKRKYQHTMLTFCDSLLLDELRGMIHALGGETGAWPMAAEGTFGAHVRAVLERYELTIAPSWSGGTAWPALRRWCGWAG